MVLDVPDQVNDLFQNYTILLGSNSTNSVGCCHSIGALLRPSLDLPRQSLALLSLHEVNDDLVPLHVLVMSAAGG